MTVSVNFPRMFLLTEGRGDHRIIYRDFWQYSFPTKPGKLPDNKEVIGQDLLLMYSENGFHLQLLNSLGMESLMMEVSNLICTLKCSMIQLGYKTT